MKKTSKRLALSLILTGFIFINLNAQKTEFFNRFVLDPYNPEYVQNEILVKFKDEVKISAKLKNGKLKTGQDWFDKWLDKIDADEMIKVFPNRKKLKSAKLFRDWKGQMREAPQLFNIYRINYKSDMDAKALAKELSKDENVEYAEPNYFVYSQGILDNSENYKSSQSTNQAINQSLSYKSVSINDPLYLDGSQWYIDAIHAPEAWELATGEGQVIAIIDTGVDWDHPDLDDNIWENPNEIPNNGIDDDNNGYIDDIRGWDWINNDNNPDDDNSHGTHVAGIAAAENNSSGIVGVAFNSKILPLKVLQSSGRGNTYDLIKGIEYAIAEEVDVINMSLGTYAESLSLKDIIIDSYADKIFTVAAAGNDGLPLIEEGIPAGFMYPACWPFVMGVQARAGFSNNDPSGPIEFWNSDGNNYEFYAPGANIMSSIPGGLYRKYNGTSMSCPQVAAACAIFKEYWDFGEYMDHVWAKLIFGSDNYINIKKSLTLNLDSIGPQLKFIDFTLVDTLPGCDRDGRADAGETIEIWATLRNCGSLADSVWGKIDFGEFEDTSVAEILDSSNYYGSISTWAWMDSELEPLRIKIGDDVAHNRDIVFTYSFGDSSNTIAGTEEYIINIEKGVELSGVLTKDSVLSNKYLYLVNESFRIGANTTLTIEPGTEIQIYPGKHIEVRGAIKAIGKPDSLIWIHPKPGERAGGFVYRYYSHPDHSVFKYCLFTDLSSPIQLGGQGGGDNNKEIEYCQFYNCGYPRGMAVFKHNIIMATTGDRLIDYCGTVDFNVFKEIKSWGGGTWHMSNNNVNNNVFSNVQMGIGMITGDWTNSGNSFINPSDGALYMTGNTTKDVIKIPNQFWGGINIEERKRIVNDFWDYVGSPQADFDPILQKPSEVCHGHIWKVEIDSINPFDEFLEPLGSGRYKFDVYFNRPMDIEYPPTVGFGVTDPWLQRIITEDAQWSADSTVWTAYYNIGQETGDGINTIHVRDAQDTEGFEIPPEYFRFKFKIQAAAAASIEFFAIAGIGKVELEWPSSETEDALGYNMYRYYNITDSTFTEPILINETLIIDSLYSDFDVIPDTTYHYQYKTVGTDLQETDFSKSMAATPFDAANGDSNGDLAVNILDLTTIVAYILGQDPKPFLVDAADVNYDSQINVLDIISIVHLIMNPQTKISKTIKTNSTPAYLWQKDSIIQLESDNQVAVMQFELEGENIEEIKLFSLLEGFEFSYGMVDGKLRGLFYSFNGNLIPYGLQDILRIENTSGDLNWVTIFGGDLSGNYVPILMGEMDDEEELLISENNMIAFPNPFSHSITLKYQIMDDALVTIELYNISGQKVKTLESSNKDAGHYEIVWDGSNGNNQSSPPGIYVCKMIINPENGDEVIVREIKIVKSN